MWKPTGEFKLALHNGAELTVIEYKEEADHTTNLDTHIHKVVYESRKLKTTQGYDVWPKEGGPDGVYIVSTPDGTVEAVRVPSEDGGSGNSAQ